MNIILIYDSAKILRFVKFTKQELLKNKHIVRGGKSYHGGGEGGGGKWLGKMMEEVNS